MLSTILVPLDGSELAERSLPFAIRLARAAEGRLILVHVASPLGWTGHDSVQRELITGLEAAAERVRAAGVSAETRVYNGYYTEAGIVIAEAARERGADLVVMSTHGRSGPGRWIYGSVADEVLRAVELPVFMVPASCKQAWPTERPLRLLVPLDGSDCAKAALEPASELADALGGELVLLSVVDPPYDVPFNAEESMTEAKAGLGPIADTLRARGRVVEVHAILGTPVSAIALAAQLQAADLIVMATHGRSGLARLVLGSAATGTIQRADVPVLLVRPMTMQRAKAQATPAATGEPGARGPIVTVALNPQELDLVERGLGGLLYGPGGDPQLAEALRRLRDRLRHVSETTSDNRSALEGIGPVSSIKQAAPGGSSAALEDAAAIESC